MPDLILTPQAGGGVILPFENKATTNVIYPIVGEELDPPITAFYYARADIYNEYGVNNATFTLSDSTGKEYSTVNAVSGNGASFDPIIFTNTDQYLNRSFYIKCTNHTVTSVDVYVHHNSKYIDCGIETDTDGRKYGWWRYRQEDNPSYAPTFEFLVYL